MTDILTRPVEAADVLQGLRRDMTIRYLADREAWEQDRSDVAAAARYEATTTALVRCLLATGDYLREADAREAVADLRARMSAEVFVERWADREGLLENLGSIAVARLADEVRDWVRQDTDLDQIPMSDLAAAYLPGAAA